MPFPQGNFKYFGSKGNWDINYTIHNIALCWFIASTHVTVITLLFNYYFFFLKSRLDLQGKIKSSLCPQGIYSHVDGQRYK